MKKSWILLMLVLFSITTTSAASTDGYMATITIDGTTNVSFADHMDSMSDGNWIELSGGEPIYLPPINLTYNGVNKTTGTYNGITIDVAIDVDEYPDHVISYPYSYHPMYTDVPGKNDVSMEFKGSTYFANKEVDVYLLRPSKTSLTESLNGIIKGNVTPINELIDSAYAKHLNLGLDGNGDVNVDMGTLGAGDYGVLVLLNSSYLEKQDDISILSATAFEVLEYDSSLDAPASVEPDTTMDVNITLIDAPDSCYTYGAVLIHEDAYKAEMELNFNGTKDGTNCTINGESLVEGFNLMGMDINDLNQNDMTTLLESIMEEDGTMYGTVVIGSTNQNILSVPTFDLPEGNYILLAGVYESGKYIVACQQSDVIVSSQTVVQKSTLSGKVESSFGTPIKDATVSIDGKSATTDINGHYEISGISKGTENATASKMNYITNTTLLNIDSLHEMFNFILTPTKATITGTVVDENGKPIKNAIVKIYSKPTQILKTSPDTNSLGKFTALVAADEGGMTYEVMVSAPRYTSTDKIEVTVNPGNTKTISSDDLTLYNNKAEMKLAKGEYSLKSAEENEIVSFMLNIINYGKPTKLDITSYNDDGLSIDLSKNQITLEDNANETITVNVSATAGVYPFTIKAENTTDNKSVIFELVAVLKNSTQPTIDKSSTVEDLTKITNGSVVFDSNVTGNATIKNGSVTGSVVSGIGSEVNDSVVMDGSFVENATISGKSIVEGSTINESAIVTKSSKVKNSTINKGQVKNSTLKNVKAFNSKVEGVELENVTIENATVVSNNGEPMIVNGSITTEEKIKFIDIYLPQNLTQLVLGHEPDNNVTQGVSNIDKRENLGVYLNQNSTESGNVSLALCSISPEGKPDVPEDAEVIGNILVIESDIPNENITRTQIRIYLDDPSIKDNFDDLTIRYQDPSTGSLIELEDCTTVYDEEIGKWYVSGYTTHYSTFMIVGENSTEDTAKTSSGGKSSGGSGGGGGSSGEAYENIAYKAAMNQYLNKDADVSYEFDNEENGISHISFVSLRNSGSITATIEVLNGRSSFADIDAPGNVYQNMNIWVGKAGFATDQNIEKPTIGFKVDISWLEENAIDTASIRLYRYNADAWNPLPTEKTDDDDEYVYFEAETPGFSPFAITSIDESVSITPEETAPIDPEETVPGAETEGSEQESEGSSAIYGIGLLFLLIGGMLAYIKMNSHQWK